MAIRGFQELLASRAAAATLPTLPPSAVQKLQIYLELLAKWNRSINLTSLTLEPLEASTLDRLLIEPLVAAQFLTEWPETQSSASPESRWIDVGSGGGSPAIPLRIVRSEGTLLMVESRGKKVAFLREVIRELQLTQTTVEAKRFEAVASVGAAHLFNLITTRAVRIDQEFVGSMAQALRPLGVVLLFTSDTEPPATPGLVLRRRASLASSPHSQVFLFQHAR